MVKTTVVIPNYNGIKYLPDCLETLQGNFNSGYEFEIVVIDNGSKDGSVEFVKEHYGNVRLVELEENVGFAAAVNIGIREAKGEYVLLLNNDIKVHSDFCAELEKCLDEDEKLFSANSVMLSMADNSILDGAGDYYSALGWAYAGYKGKAASKVVGGRKRHLFSACGGASVYRKSILTEIGLFDENHFAYLEDIDVGYRARIRGYKSVLCASAVCEHAGSGFSGSRYNDFKIGLSGRNSIYIIYKNMPCLQILINLPFLLVGFGIKLAFFMMKGYGKAYIKALREGFKLCRSAENKKVKFEGRYTGNYLIIQFELWINMFRRLFV